eukprot:141810-Pyramimonas_sp.AAC.1
MATLHAGTLPVHVLQTCGLATRGAGALSLAGVPPSCGRHASWFCGGAPDLRKWRPVQRAPCTCERLSPTCR